MATNQIKFEISVRWYLIKPILFFLKILVHLRLISIKKCEKIITKTMNFIIKTKQITT